MKTKDASAWAVYQIYVPSFADGNGDGIGDFAGIRSHFDAFSALGIQVLDLSPIFASPKRDDGKDVSDYLSLRPGFGSLDEFKQLLQDAKERNLKIILDFPIHHVSINHPWFKASFDLNSPYRSCFVWSVGRKKNRLPPNNWTMLSGESAWTYVPEAKAWYLHTRRKGEADINGDAAKFQEEMEKIFRFYLDLGVYGFRFDAIDSLCKESLERGKHARYQIGQEHCHDTENDHILFQKFHDDVFSHYDCMTIGVTGEIPYKNARRFVGEAVDFVQPASYGWGQQKKPSPTTATYSLKEFRQMIFTWQQELDWNVPYLENADLPRSLNRLNVNPRLAPMASKALGTLLFSLRGVPFLYQGEELGMMNYPSLEPRDFLDPDAAIFYEALRRKHHCSVRRAEKIVNRVTADHAHQPYPWKEGEYVGFSNHEPWIKVAKNASEMALEKQQKDPTSVWSYYRDLLKFRSQSPTLREGDFEPLQTKSNILAYWRSYQGEMLFVLINLTGHRVHLPRTISTMVGQVVVSNYPHAGLTYKKWLRPYEALIAKVK